jgi:hypothetical protein
MHRLAILKFCRDELAERKRSDPWQGWFWCIRHKVINYWIAVLERSLDVSPAACAPGPCDLTPEERQLVRRSHPLLAPRPVTADAVLQLDREWQAELQRRVETYVTALKAQR